MRRPLGFGRSVGIAAKGVQQVALPAQKDRACGTLRREGYDLTHQAGRADVPGTEAGPPERSKALLLAGTFADFVLKSSRCRTLQFSGGSVAA